MCYYIYWTKCHNVSSTSYCIHNRAWRLHITSWEVLFKGLKNEKTWLLIQRFFIDKYDPTETFESNSRPKWLNYSSIKTIKQKHKAWNTNKVTHHLNYFRLVSYTTKRKITINYAAAIKRAKPNLELKLVDSVKNILQ